MDAIRVVLAHDHPILGVGTHILEQMRHLFHDLAPDTLLIEMALDNELEPSSAQHASLAPAATQVFVLRGYHNRAYVFGVLAGASAKCLEEHDALLMISAVIQERLEGNVVGHQIVTKLPIRQQEDAKPIYPELTTREIEILQQLAAGKSNRAMSQHFDISESTIRYHLKNIYQKLGVSHRSEAIVWAVRAGWGDA